jgi:hypothetical protein
VPTSAMIISCKFFFNGIYLGGAQSIRAGTAE